MNCGTPVTFGSAMPHFDQVSAVNRAMATVDSDRNRLIPTGALIPAKPFATRNPVCRIETETLRLDRLR